MYPPDMATTHYPSRSEPMWRSEREREVGPGAGALESDSVQSPPTGQLGSPRHSLRSCERVQVIVQSLQLNTQENAQKAEHNADCKAVCGRVS